MYALLSAGVLVLVLALMNAHLRSRRIRGRIRRRVLSPGARAVGKQTYSTALVWVCSNCGRDGQERTGCSLPNCSTFPTTFALPISSGGTTEAGQPGVVSRTEVKR